MTSTARSRPSTSASRPFNATPRQSSRPINLPTYQPLTHPLNPIAQHALHNVPTTHPLSDLKRRLNAAVENLTNITGDLNDQYQVKRAEFDKAKARKAARARDAESSQGAENEDDDEGDRRMEDAWNDVEDWTAKMEAGTRRVIDIQARVESTETALKELDTNVSHGRTATQSTLGASQFRSQRQRRQQQQQRLDENDEDEGAESDEAEEEQPPFAGPPILTSFKSKLSASTTAYTSLPLKDRYASHNAYIGFRKIVHDARHPDDDTPMPHASTWFPSSSSSTAENANTHNNNRTIKSRPHQSATQQHHSSPNSDNEDLTIALEKRSIRCPLTLLPLLNPLTSTLCPHSFESDAILSMLAVSSLRADGSTGAVDRPGDRAMKCPVCEKLLTKETLAKDPVLVRKIKRIEDKERRMRDGDGEEDEDEMVGEVGRREEVVTSSPVGVRSAGKGGMLKRERMSLVRGERDVSVVPDSQVVDLGDGEGEEEEEEEE